MTGVPYAAKGATSRARRDASARYAASRARPCSSAARSRRRRALAGIGSGGGASPGGSPRDRGSRSRTRGRAAPAPPGGEDVVARAGAERGGEGVVELPDPHGDPERRGVFARTMRGSSRHSGRLQV